MYCFIFSESWSIRCLTREHSTHNKREMFVTAPVSTSKAQKTMLKSKDSSQMSDTFVEKQQKNIIKMFLMLICEKRTVPSLHLKHVEDVRH